MADGGKNTKEGILGRESLYKSMLSQNFSVPIYNKVKDLYHIRLKHRTPEVDD